MGVEGYGDNIVGVRRYFLFNIFIEDMKNFFLVCYKYGGIYRIIRVFDYFCFFIIN